jgi:hypothetical protein
MPLQPNFIERFFINRGEVPGIMVDMALPAFQLQAMLGAMEIGFFRHLRDEPADLETIAARTGASVRGIKNLVRVLKPLGYIKEEQGTYSLTKLAHKMPIDELERMAPFFKHNIAKVTPEVGEGIKNAPENGVYGWEHVKSGEVGRGYQASMRWLASSMVDEVVKKIDLPSNAEHMLDLGGSHGLYTVEFCRKYPQLKGTVLDWEIGLEEAEKTLKEHTDVANRINLVERDFEEEALPDGYDFVFLGNIIHGISPDGNRELFDKISQATTDRGMIGIQDQFAGIKGSKFARAVAGLAGLNLFLFSGGRAHDYDDVQQWLAEVGFTNANLHKLKQPGMSLVTAHKE